MFSFHLLLGLPGSLFPSLLLPSDPPDLSLSSEKKQQSKYAEYQASVGLGQILGVTGTVFAALMVRESHKVGRR